jgi:hypothetical protein
MYFFSGLFKELRKNIKDEFEGLNFKCRSPPSFHSVPFIAIPPEELVCNLTTGCPQGCHCVRQPAYDHVIVECVDVIMTSLPDIMPELQGTERLSLRFRNTSTQSLQARGYLQKTKELDLRGNELEEVSREAGLQLKDVDRLDMRNNRLNTLPDSLRVVYPDAVLLDGNLLQ